jgi:hypothetical protein
LAAGSVTLNKTRTAVSKLAKNSQDTKVAKPATQALASLASWLFLAGLLTFSTNPA